MYHSLEKLRLPRQTRAPYREEAVHVNKENDLIRAMSGRATGRATKRKKQRMEIIQCPWKPMRLV